MYIRHISYITRAHHSYIISYHILYIIYYISYIIPYRILYHIILYHTVYNISCGIVNSLSLSRLLRKHPQNEVSLFIRWECRGDDYVCTRLQHVSATNLSRVDECRGLGVRRIVLEEVQIQVPVHFFFQLSEQRSINRHHIPTVNTLSILIAVEIHR